MYTYAQMKDGSKAGVITEVSNGLAKAAAWFHTTHGLPVEIFKEDMDARSNVDKLLWYMNFRNDHPEVFVSN